MNNDIMAKKKKGKQVEQPFVDQKILLNFQIHIFAFILPIMNICMKECSAIVINFFNFFFHIFCSICVNCIWN